MATLKNIEFLSIIIPTILKVVIKSPVILASGKTICISSEPIIKSEMSLPLISTFANFIEVT